MRIFKEGRMIRMQLVDNKTGAMLFDFAIPQNLFEGLRDHIIEHLQEFKIKGN